ncbi:inositol polyphosphate 1-phosphatase-like [Asterias rubens]|uniref:inositol polyphosphate 1-phosphatase-like n=1 Tax=Asterias rubens TaxID=7604 RepID=UPI0014557831|nr:inositol polyphosphate 1-phosphatase-like [Asterias rubens]
MAALLCSLVALSEKAANLARIIRSEKALFDLLVEEKKGEQKNKRFLQDFKTLGDVLIQEMIRHDIAQKFPSLEDNVFGEESNTFTNTLGESITVAVQPTEAQTCTLLTKVLDGNACAASLLAKAVHQEIHMPPDSRLDNLSVEVDFDSLGIWIDPIDGTAQYIKGRSEDTPADGIHEEGLKCAIILIGVFNRNNGDSLMGVVNQPFDIIDQGDRWRGRHVWGVSCGDTQVNSLPSMPANNDPSTPGISVILSRSEEEDIKTALRPITDGKVKYAGGAGYKMLCTIDYLVDAYILSKGSTFKWDTCAPHAILKSMNGGMANLAKALEIYREFVKKGSGDGSDSAGLDLREAELRYEEPDANGSKEAGQKWANAGGIVAYRSKDVLLQVLETLSNYSNL